MFIQELLVNQARLEEELVRTERHAPILHTSYFEVRHVVISHRSQEAAAQRSDTHAENRDLVARLSSQRYQVESARDAQP